MRTRVSATIDFEQSGNAGNHLLYGWSVQEPTHIWSTGPESALVVAAPTAPHGYILEINWRPHTVYPMLEAQAVTVRVNGQRVYGGAVTQDGVVGLRCPAPPPDVKSLVITFEHPDAACPRQFGISDDRVLALLVRRVRLLALTHPIVAGSGARSQLLLEAKNVPDLTAELESVVGASIADVVAHFEMLCGNCDMGLAQRGLGFEPLSLLRFAGTFPAISIKGLETSFSELGSRIEPWAAKHEWMITDHFGVQYHTGQLVADVQREQLIQMERGRIAFCVENFWRISRMQRRYSLLIVYPRRSQACFLCSARSTVLGTLAGCCGSLQRKVKPNADSSRKYCLACLSPVWSACNRTC